MPYPHKYAAGQIVETNGKGEGSFHERRVVVLIGSWQTLQPYSTIMHNRTQFDDSAPDHIIYAGFGPEHTWNAFRWYWEADVDHYCQNLNRGRKIVKEIPYNLIAKSLGITSNKWNQYMETFLSLEPETEPSTESGVVVPTLNIQMPIQRYI